METVTWQYEAMDATGMEINDVVEAPDQDAAMDEIRRKGLFVTKISRKRVPVAEGGPTTGRQFVDFIQTHQKDVIYSSIIFVLILMIVMAISK